MLADLAKLDDLNGTPSKKDEGETSDVPTVTVAEAVSIVRRLVSEYERETGGHVEGFASFGKASLEAPAPAADSSVQQ